MITVKRVNGKPLIVNCDVIETIELSTHAVISMTTGDRLIVDESHEEILRKIIEYKRAIHTHKPQQ
jgi:flagellar protein FlbD